MNLYKRPEKETDPDKLPGQIVNRPTHVGTLQKEIEDFLAHPPSRHCYCEECRNYFDYPGRSE